MKRLNQTQLTATHTDNENKGEIPAVVWVTSLAGSLHYWGNESETQNRGRAAYPPGHRWSFPVWRQFFLQTQHAFRSAEGMRITAAIPSQCVRLWFIVAHSEILAWKSIKINSCVCCWVQTTHLFQFISENFDLLFIFVFFLWILHIENKQNLI